MESLNKKYTRLGNKQQLSRLNRWLARLLRDVFEILIILAAVILVILSILYLENTLEQQKTWGKFFIQSIEESRILGTFESISIVTALVVYLRRGKKQSHYEAWQVIDSAQGLEFSHARIKALEELAKDGISLKGLLLPKANLEQIHVVDGDFKEVNLQGAKLQEANLQGSTFELTQLQGANLWKANLQETSFLLAQMQKINLSSANLSYADLQGVNLLEANLQKAELQGAYILGNLQGADFQEANLKGTILEGAYLKEANFQNANLRGANLKDANLQGANLQGANLQGVNFQNAKGLHPSQVLEAENWEFARYSQEFIYQLGLKLKSSN
ncbi:pentapeptide repeat-containing protein [Limnoraphis robusta]|uniref:Pentapeptide repeat-containing protein n=1 Tax=Limnoraphis robusta CCNP1315 TaxID=3110306 RepID=A0ABU5TWZ4_9CYAN|nr:pentapeptide repeat-containing protein [Limnoraphis robusta]MEA5519429.1 pentapeptide repeat-containing protein [Limnoraphis robusta CCNP1315]MEA5549115.1 pentapeptide repeat-containing protein [Limnoraphis robusta CCNP1324]